MELWKPVVGYEGLYEVSDLGRVRSIRRMIPVVRNGIMYETPIGGNILKPQKLSHGYVGVWLYGKDCIAGKNGKPFSVHRIVARAFCENPNGYDEVNHKNEIKWDNRAKNLEWCTHIENSQYGTRGERIGKKLKNGVRSREVYQYTPEGVFVAKYPSMAEAQRSTGYRKGNIWKQMTGKYETAYGYIWKRE